MFLELHSLCEFIKCVLCLVSFSSTMSQGVIMTCKTPTSISRKLLRSTLAQTNCHKNSLDKVTIWRHHEQSFRRTSICVDVHSRVSYLTIWITGWGKSCFMRKKILVMQRDHTHDNGLKSQLPVRGPGRISLFQAGSYSSWWQHVHFTGDR